MRNMDRILVVSGVSSRMVVTEGIFQELVLMDRDTGEEVLLPLVEGQYEMLMAFYTREDDGVEGQVEEEPRARTSVPVPERAEGPTVQRPSRVPEPEYATDPDYEEYTDPDDSEVDDDADVTEAPTGLRL